MMSPYLGQPKIRTYISKKLRRRNFSGFIPFLRLLYTTRKKLGAFCLGKADRILAHGFPLLRNYSDHTVCRKINLTELVSCAQSTHRLIYCDSAAPELPVKLRLRIPLPSASQSILLPSIVEIQVLNLVLHGIPGSNLRITSLLSLSKRSHHFLFPIQLSLDKIPDILTHVLTELKSLRTRQA